MLAIFNKQNTSLIEANYDLSVISHNVKKKIIFSYLAQNLHGETRMMKNFRNQNVMTLGHTLYLV